jgi:protoheme IX farnesyltransferase
MIKHYFQLIKYSILKHALITFSIGYFLAEFPNSIVRSHYIAVSFGFLLIAAASATINHIMESNYDFKMTRTMHRPIASGKVSSVNAWVFAMVLLGVGVLILVLNAALHSLFWSMMMLTLYNFVYTPLKRISWLNTYVGSIPGAMPPVCGWTAVSGVSIELWILFFVFFIWQIPHFFALGWKYRHQYNAAGFKMLPCEDPSGRRTSWHIILSTAALTGVVMLLTFVMNFSMIYLAISMILSLAFLFCAGLFFKTPNDNNAKYLFLGSIIYQPILVFLMLLDRVIYGV